MNPGDGVLYPNAGLPDLREPDRVLRRHRSAVPLHADGHWLRDRPRSPAQPDHAGHEGADLQQPAEPARLRELARRDARARRPGHRATTCGCSATRPTSRCGTRAPAIRSRRLPGMRERTVILYTFSKKFAMTGWRLGAAIGPDDLIAQITKLNTNDESCTTHFVQAAGVEALQRRPVRSTGDPGRAANAVATPPSSNSRWSPGS